MIGIWTESLIKKGGITDQEREITRCNNIAFTATEKGEAKVGAGKGEKGKARSTFMRTIRALDWLINGLNSKSTKSPEACLL